MPTGDGKAELLQGTLDLVVLRTLQTMGPQHGFGLAKRIGQISAGALELNQGTLYPGLLRLEQRGWIRSSCNMVARTGPHLAAPNLLV